MTLYTSGDMQVCDHSLHLLHEIYDWFYIKYGEFRELYYKDRAQQLESSEKRKTKQISTIRHFQGEAEN